MAIQIQFDEQTGAVNVGTTENFPGGLGNRMMIYGLMEIAKDVIVEWNKQHENKVQLASGLNIPNIKQN